MTGPRWYTFAELARATGLTERQIRHLADSGQITYQQNQWNSPRRLNNQTVADLEALGIPVHLGNTGKDGNTGKSGNKTPEGESLTHD